VNEIEELTIKYGIKEIYDCSDEINNSMPHALAICEEIKRRNIDITWKSSVRANPLSEKLVKARCGIRVLVCPAGDREWQ